MQGCGTSHVCPPTFGCSLTDEVWWYVLQIFQRLVARLSSWSHVRCFLTMVCLYVTRNGILILLSYIFIACGYILYISVYTLDDIPLFSLDRAAGLHCSKCCEVLPWQAQRVGRNWRSAIGWWRRRSTSRPRLSGSEWVGPCSADVDLCRRFGFNILEKVSCYQNI